jgi:hypothetical protein
MGGNASRVRRARARFLCVPSSARGVLGTVPCEQRFLLSIPSLLSRCLVGAAGAIPSQFFCWALLFCFCSAIIASGRAHQRRRAARRTRAPRARRRVGIFGSPVSRARCSIRPSAARSLGSGAAGVHARHIATLQGRCEALFAALSSSDLLHHPSARRPPLGVRLEID